MDWSNVTDAASQQWKPMARPLDSMAPDLRFQLARHGPFLLTMLVPLRQPEHANYCLAAGWLVSAGLSTLRCQQQMLSVALHYLQLPVWQLEVQAPTGKIDLHESVLQHLGKGCLELSDARHVVVKEHAGGDVVGALLEPPLNEVNREPVLSNLHGDGQSSHLAGSLLPQKSRQDCPLAISCPASKLAACKAGVEAQKGLPANSTAAHKAGLSRMQAKSWQEMLLATEQASERQCTDRHDDVAFLVSMTPADPQPHYSCAWHLLQKFWGA